MATPCPHELEHCSCSYGPTSRRPNSGAAARLAQSLFAITTTGEDTSLSYSTRGHQDLRKEVPNSPSAPKPSKPKVTSPSIAGVKQDATLAALMALTNKG